MKILLTLVASFLVAGCAGSSLPEFPDIKDHYVVDVKDEVLPAYIATAITNLQEIPAPVEVVRCLKFEIVSKVPYKIKFIAEVPVKECNGVGGYKPKDSVSLLNWIDDVTKWAETKKKCFK